MIPFHPLANIFPLIEGDEFEQLVVDIKVNGLRERIVVHDGQVLDGRNRYNAAIAAGLFSAEGPIKGGTPIFIKHFAKFLPDREGDPLTFVISKNLKRRHLNESQRAMAAARVARLGQGARTDLSPIGEKSQAERAKIMNVGKRTVERADTVLDKADPELVRAVEQGKLAVSAAAQAVTFGPDQQRRIAAEAEAGHANVVRKVIKQEARAAREVELGELQRTLPDLKCGLILEDYEWDDTVYSRETGMDRHAANHYPVSEDAHTAEEIVARRSIESIVDPRGCMLWMWSTIQHLAIAMDVMKLRGFIYKSHYAWGKDRISLGRWNRGKHELLLIGTRGAPPCPAPGTQWDSLIMAKKSEHSAKPECFLEMLEDYFPTLVKIELNRRGPPRPGWAAWGNEVEPLTRAQRALTNEHGMVRLPDGALVPAAFVTPEEWVSLIPAHHAETGELIEPSAGEAETSKASRAAMAQEIVGNGSGSLGGDHPGAGREPASRPDNANAGSFTLDALTFPCCKAGDDVAGAPKPDPMDIPAFLPRQAPAGREIVAIPGGHSQ